MHYLLAGYKRNSKKKGNKKSYVMVHIPVTKRASVSPAKGKEFKTLTTHDL